MVVRVPLFSYIFKRAFYNACNLDTRTTAINTGIIRFLIFVPILTSGITFLDFI